MNDVASDLRWAMLADDVTGGCDAGVQFSLRGAPTRVYLDLPQEPGAFAGLSVLIHHSRGDTPRQANRQVQKACAWIEASGAKLCYKKIDSTLKGNVGSELETLRRSLPDRLVLVSPSFPKMERIFLNGWLRVRSSEAIEPIHLPSMLADQGARRLAHITQSAGASDALVERIRQAEAAGARIIVVDAVSENHLRAVAEAAYRIVPQPLLVGSAGLAAHWSELLLKQGGRGTNAVREPIRVAPRVSGACAAVSAAGSVVLCIGSTNPVTCQQLERLTDTQRVLKFNLQQDHPSQALAALARGCHLAVSVPVRRDSADPRNLRRLFSAMVETSHVRGLLCSGGDTARMVCAVLGVQAIQLGGEILPGLPWGTLAGGAADRLPICTKAGGFGDQEALCHAVSFLAAQPRSQENRDRDC